VTTAVCFDVYEVNFHALERENRCEFVPYRNDNIVQDVEQFIRTGVCMSSQVTGISDFCIRNSIDRTVV
jgi:hypothetical protein